MGLFDFIHLSIVLGKDIKKTFQILGIELSENYKLTEEDIDKIIAVFGNMGVIINNKLGIKNCREFSYILSIYDKSKFIGLNPKNFSYKLYKYHGETIHGLYLDNEKDIDMKRLEKLYGY